MDKYKELQEKFNQFIFDNSEKEEQKAYTLQKKDREEVLNFIAKILLEYTIIDSGLNVSSKDQKVIISDFNNIIVKIAKDEYKNENAIIDDILTTATKDKYYTNAYATDIGYSFKLQKITDEEIQKIVNSAIDGKNWSDRLWTNKKELEANLRAEVEKFLQGKTDVNKISQVIKDRFGQNAFNTRRLTQTEVARCQLQANELFAENEGVEYMMFTATLDGRTSNFCREHDGNRYGIDDDNRPELPHHPFERSLYINIPSPDWKAKQRRDQANNEIIDYTTYENWLDNQDL
ncbi:phage head morphogenesis protein [Clostridium sp. C8-1-8]|uniref:phage head morphogenesis protein n=1 Tax=Clostridium sp. C8-1-8 TaxID=2698831 RepID=UPI00136D5D63|nr:phage head morphogenesis protein [Clostridium sp. C8-1-8]